MKEQHSRRLLAVLLPLVLLSVTGCAHHHHGTVIVPATDAPSELRKVLLPPYIIEPPDILVVEAIPTLDQPVAGQHLVRPDGTISLGVYGSVPVAGLTIDEATEMVRRQLAGRVKEKELQVSVDVLAYNSKVYYVITDGGGYGEQVFQFPIKGNETVLDAIAQINGLPAVASKKYIWIARRAPEDLHGDQILPVDWIAITEKGITATNYQVLPGDRVYVKADPWFTADAIVAKVLSPFERILGITLLGSQTVNSIQGRNVGGGF
jgi:polysaccharide export outer membrane protein